jgi:thioredoxin 1
LALILKGKQSIVERISKKEVVMKEVDKETFETEVVNSELPVVVDFWGPQCVPCLALMPSVESLAGAYVGRVKVAKVEAPKNKRLCLSLKVLALPTFLFYKNGKEVRRLSGDSVSSRMIEDALQEML